MCKNINNYFINLHAFEICIIIMSFIHVEMCAKHKFIYLSVVFASHFFIFAIVSSKCLHIAGKNNFILFVTSTGLGNNSHTIEFYFPIVFMRSNFYMKSFLRLHSTLLLHPSIHEATVCTTAVI